MSDYIRVRQNETGHELSVPRAHAEASDGYTVLDKPGADLAGNPLPPKYKTTVDAAATQKTPASKAGSRPTTDGRQADNQKENV